MKISYNWLKSYIPQIPDPKKMEDIFTFHICEVEGVETLPHDTIFDIKILPDRAGDLLSHIGVARELAGLLGIAFNYAKLQSYAAPVSHPTALVIDIQTPKCNRYMGRIVRNVTVGPSPQWMVDYLASIGQRSINSIVDLTNFVMFDCGHPVHAFDLKKLASEKIIVQESTTSFDFPVVGSENIVASIKEGDILIADTDTPIALAGIKGGTNSGISIDAPYTTDIVLEVANFDSTTIRKTGQRLSLFSDARKRFENKVSWQLTPIAMHQLSALLSEMCPNAVLEDIVDVYPNPTPQEKKVSFTTIIINEKLGITLTPSDIATILQNYHYEYIEEHGNFIVNIPFWRQDINGIHDMVEEIGRVYGYEKIQGILPDFHASQNHDETYLKIEGVKKYLTTLGFHEVMTYSFTKKGDIQVARGVKGKDYLRTNLVDGVKESYEMNRLNAPLLGIMDVQLFEIGTVFLKDREEIHVALATKKGIEEMTLDEYISKNNTDTTNIILDALPTGEKKNFTAWSVYPFITRDVSFWSDTEITESDFIEIIKPVLGILSPRDPFIIDQFTKDGRYSYAFRFVFQSYEKTLTDEDIEGEWSKVLNMIKQQSWEVR